MSLRSLPTSAETDSLGRSYRAAVALLGLLLLSGHWRIAAAWPMVGMWLALGAALLTCLAALLGFRARIEMRDVAAPALALTLFAAWAFVRTVFSVVPTMGYEIVGFFVQGVAFFWLGVFVVRGAGMTVGSDDVSLRRKAEQTALRVAVGFFAFLTLVFGLHGIYEYHVAYPARLERFLTSGLFDPTDYLGEGVAYAFWQRRASSQFGNPNVLCAFLAMGLPLVAAVGWGLLRREGTRGRRMAVRVALAIAACIVFYAASRTGSAGGRLVMLVGMAAVAGVWLVARRGATRSQRGRSAAWIVAGLLVFVALNLVPHRPIGKDPRPPQKKAPPIATASPVEATATEKPPVSLATRLRQVRTIEQRLYYWQIGMRIWQRAPLLGHGVGGFKRLYPAERVPGAGETVYAHNFPIQLAAETGLLGLGLFLWFLALLARRFLTGLRAGSVRAAWLGLACFLALFLLDSLGDYLFLVREVYLDFCLAAGLFCAATPRREPEERSHVLPIAALALGALLYFGSLWLVTVSAFMGQYYHQTAEDAMSDLRGPYRPASARASQLLREASAAADKALEWQSSNPYALQTRGYVFAQSRQIGKATDIQRRACMLQPDSGSMRALLASYLSVQGDREQALLLMHEAIARHPLEPEHRRQQGRLLLEMGRRAEALEAAREAVRLARLSRNPLDKRMGQELLAEVEKHLRNNRAEQ